MDIYLQVYPVWSEKIIYFSWLPRQSWHFSSHTHFHAVNDINHSQKPQTYNGSYSWNTNRINLCKLYIKPFKNKEHKSTCEKYHPYKGSHFRPSFRTYLTCPSAFCRMANMSAMIQSATMENTTLINGTVMVSDSMILSGAILFTKKKKRKKTTFSHDMHQLFCNIYR